MAIANKTGRGERVQTLLAAELATYEKRTPESRSLAERARRSMPFGVASSFQVAKPYPIYIQRGLGSQIIDVDGNEYVDYHNGFGSMVVGHAHPLVRAAIKKAAATGTHFASSTNDVVLLAEELNRRFGMERVRFCNSGTEATMDSIRLARAASGKDVLLKVEGAYHGHHDAAMFSLRSSLDAGEPWDVPSSRGIPAALGPLTMTVPFNDAAALEEVLSSHGDRIGTFILEPVMMNIGIVPPRPGYLEKVRALCDRHSVVLIFDEVKTGATIAPGGATELYGVQPDLICLAKSIGGGTPIGAFGGKASVMDEIEQGVAAQGTFNGNPLSVAAALATLTEVLTPAAYQLLARLGTRLASGAAKVLDEAGIPAHTIDLGCKGAIVFRDSPVDNYRDYVEVDDSLFSAYWYFMVNRGIFATPGKDEQWTISVQHSESDIDRTIDVLSSYCDVIS